MLVAVRSLPGRGVLRVTGDTRALRVAGPQPGRVGGFEMGFRDLVFIMWSSFRSMDACGSGRGPKQHMVSCLICSLLRT